MGGIYRSTKAGALAPATRCPKGSGGRISDRSTKAGALAPATHGDRRGDARLAQRSTKAGALAPATHVGLEHERVPADALNEGRGSRPGDTDCLEAFPSPRTHAQRRPGLSPRRHPDGELVPALAERRSTKAGALAPATPPVRARSTLLRSRSTKAGALAPATRGYRQLSVHNKYRSTKAGALAPATPDRRGAVQDAWIVAQRRPGLSPRRHDATEQLPSMLNNAQRRPGLSPRRHSQHLREEEEMSDRSTKAGALAPATPSATSSRTATGTTLNEGRGSRPGDTANPVSAAVTRRKMRATLAPMATFLASLRYFSSASPMISRMSRTGSDSTYRITGGSQTALYVQGIARRCCHKAP